MNKNIWEKNKNKNKTIKDLQYCLRKTFQLSLSWQEGVEIAAGSLHLLPEGVL